MTEGLTISIPQRLFLIRITACLSLVVSVILSLNLWGGERIFPYAPIFSNLFIQSPYDYLLVACFVIFIICSLFLNKQRLLLFIALSIGVFLVCIDINRLQPWFYFYFMLLFVGLFYDGRIDDANKYTSYFIVLQLLFCSIYIFNGISLLNIAFVNTEFPELIAPLSAFMSERQFLFVKKMGAFMPYYLVFLGVALLIRAIRYLAITFAVVLHILLIIFLFPSGINQNYAIWFLNVAYIPLLFLLFSGKTKQRYYSPTLLFKFPLFYFVILLFWILPFFNYKNRWPDNLSGNFKSASLNSVKIKFTTTVLKQLPNYVRCFCYEEDHLNILDYNAWCRHELKSNCYQETIVFNSLHNYLKQQSGASVNDLQIDIKPKQNVLFKR